MATFRKTEESNLRSISFGHEQAQRPHSVGRELNDLREDVELAFERIEGGDNIPEVHIGTITNDADNDKVGCAFKGINFLAGRSLATVTLDDALKLNAVGKAGNDVTVEVVAGVGVAAVAVTGNHIKITTGDDATNASNAILASAAATALVVPEVLDGGADLTALATTSLTGGSGDGLTVSAYNATTGASASTTDLTYVTAISDTALTVAALPLAHAAAEIIAVTFESHTAKSNVQTHTAT